MIPPEAFIPILYGLLVFVLFAWVVLAKLIDLGLKYRYPVQWEKDRQVRRQRWQHRRERLSSIFR